MNSNGSIKVNNQGYDYIKNEWKQSIGKAKFVKNSNEARLKVSFFGPFYVGYNVIAMDKDYRYALVAGANLKVCGFCPAKPVFPERSKKII